MDNEVVSYKYISRKSRRMRYMDNKKRIFVRNFSYNSRKLKPVMITAYIMSRESQINAPKLLNIINKYVNRSRSLSL